MQIDIFASSGEITAAARSPLELYSNWTIEILGGELLSADIKVQRELLTSTGIASTWTCVQASDSHPLHQQQSFQD
jgi:hypothetical protein